MNRRNQLVLVLGAWTLAAGTMAAQSVSEETYDFNFIGRPLADPVLQHAKETT